MTLSVMDLDKKIRRMRVELDALRKQTERVRKKLSAVRVIELSGGRKGRRAQ